MEDHDDYTYLRIEDARKAIGQKVNLFAAVAEIRAPRMSKGTDYVLSLKVVDQSHQAPRLSINFFAEQPSKLPHVNSSGDLICLHAVMIGLHNGEVYCSFKKKVSSFALYKGKTGEDMTPYQTSTNFHGLPQDEMFIKRLREWVLNQGLGMDTYTLELRGMKVGLVFDLVCKVLHVCECTENEWTFFVWDGTDASPASFPSIDVGEKNDVPLHVGASHLPRDILCSFPCVGTVLTVTTKASFKEILQLQGGQLWARLCNIVCEIHDGIWKGVMQTMSKIHLLSEGDKNVFIRERFYKERTSLERQLRLFRRPLTSFPWPSRITETDYEDAIDATLMDSLTNAEVTHKLKCVVRVVAAYPWNFKDLCCPEQGYYKVKLTLEDPTARIHAFLFKEDGVKFFGGYPAADDLRVKWNKLLGIHEDDNCAVRDPPWVFFCLKSFYADKKDPWGSRKYRIFNTKLVK